MSIYKWSDLIGNKVTFSLMQRAAVNGTIRNFGIISGALGTGKTSSLKLLAMTLTCRNLVDNNPCLKCDKCVENMQAFSRSGTASNVSMKNLGAQRNKKDFSDLMTELFDLKGAVGRTFYGLGEIHGLSHEEQTAMLEEIDKLDPNTYIVGTTTQQERLLPELLSRAIGAVYDLKRLDHSEQKLLFDTTLKQMNIKSVSKEVERLILSRGKGIPRDIVSLIKVIKDQSPTDEELFSFLSQISNRTIIGLFTSMQGPMQDLAFYIDTLLQKYSVDSIIRHLKNFMVDAMLSLDGTVLDAVSTEDSSAIRKLFSEKNVYKVSRIVKNLNPISSSEFDLKLNLIELRQLLRSQTLGDIVTRSKGEAVKQDLNAHVAATSNKNAEVDTGLSGIKPISPKSFMNEFNEG